MKDAKVAEDSNKLPLHGEPDKMNKTQGEKSQASHFLPTSRRIVQFSNGKVYSIVFRNLIIIILSIVEYNCPFLLL